ncbi:hypothetical protein ACEPAI_1396 [Sanghuangporus weigelae]
MAYGGHTRATDYEQANMLKSLKHLTYFVFDPSRGNAHFVPGVLDLKDVEVIEDLRDRMYKKHKVLHDNIDISELELYKKPDDIKKRGEGELLDRAMASITGKALLDADEEVNDVFGQDLGKGQVHLVVKIRTNPTFSKRLRSPSEDNESTRLKKILKRAPSSLSSPSTFEDVAQDVVYINRPFDYLRFPSSYSNHSSDNSRMIVQHRQQHGHKSFFKGSLQLHAHGMTMGHLVGRQFSAL